MRLGAMNPEEPFSGVTVPVKIDYSRSRVNEVIESSRSLYAKKYTESATKVAPKKEKIKPKTIEIVP